MEVWICRINHTTKIIKVSLTILKCKEWAMTTGLNGLKNKTCLNLMHNLQIKSHRVKKCTNQPRMLSNQNRKWIFHLWGKNLWIAITNRHKAILQNFWELINQQYISQIINLTAVLRNPQPLSNLKCFNSNMNTCKSQIF